jgi:hypothetical protein
MTAIAMLEELSQGARSRRRHVSAAGGENRFAHRHKINTLVAIRAIRARQAPRLYIQ